MNVRLVTFATTTQYKFNQYILNMSALKFGGISEVSSWDLDKIKKEEFYKKHYAILDHKRGAGYWLWKPYIILQELKRGNYGDYIIYSDCRDKQWLLRSVETLLKWCSDNRGVLPGVYIPYYGACRKWTKRDCFVLMGCDEEAYWNHCQIQASFSVWKKNELSLLFVDNWLRYCTDERILTDIANTCSLPDFPDFIEHRHDQSVLTICAIEKGMRALGNPLNPIPFCDNDKNIDKVLTAMGEASVKSLQSMAFTAFVNCLWFSIHVLRKLRLNGCMHLMINLIRRCAGRPSCC